MGDAFLFTISNRDEPFFLYLADNMPHVPIYAAEEFRGRSLGGLYGDVIEAIDWSTGRILDQLTQLGIDERTLVIFTSDNGPWSNMPDRMFGEELLPGHERIRPWHADTSGLLRGSKATTYEGGFRVPAILRWPGRIPAGRVSAEAERKQATGDHPCNGEVFLRCLSALPAGRRIPLGPSSKFGVSRTVRDSRRSATAPSCRRRRASTRGSPP